MKLYFMLCQSFSPSILAKRVAKILRLKMLKVANFNKNIEILHILQIITPRIMFFFIPALQPLHCSRNICKKNISNNVLLKLLKLFNFCKKVAIFAQFAICKFRKICFCTLVVVSFHFSKNTIWICVLNYSSFIPVPFPLEN